MNYILTEYLLKRGCMTGGFWTSGHGRALNIPFPILVALFFIGLFVTIGLDASVSPAVLVHAGDAVTGTAGVSVQEASCDSSSHFYLTTGSPTGLASSLHLVSGDNYVMNTTETTRGLRVDLRWPDQVVYSDFAQGSVGYYAPLDIAVGNLMWLSASMALKSISGSFNVRFDASWKSGSLWNYLEYGAYSINVTSGQEQHMSLDMPIGTIQMTASSFIVATRLIVIIKPNNPNAGEASLLIHNLTYEAFSSKYLSPVRIDVQTESGSSIYGNPFSAYLVKPPIVNLTRKSDGKSAMFTPRSVNDTLYLPPDNYSANVGWPRLYSGFGSWAPYSFYFQLRENRTIFVAARIPTISVEFDSQPEFRITTFAIGGSSNEVNYFNGFGSYYDYYDMESFYIGPPLILYLPGAETKFDCVFIQEITWHASEYMWLSLSEQGGSVNIVVSTAYPSAVIVGLALTDADFIGDLLISVFLIGLAATVFPILLDRKRYGSYPDPDAFAFLLVLASAFFPWFTYDLRSQFASQIWGNGASGQGLIMIPLLIGIDQMKSGPALKLNLGIVASFWVVLLFWLPLIFWFWRLQEKQRTHRSPGNGELLVPTILAVFLLIWGFSVQLIPSIGVCLVIFAFVYRVLLVQRQRATEKATVSPPVGTPQA